MRILPGNSLLLPFLEFVTGYSKAADKTSFLTQLAKGDQWTNDQLRFAAYQALIHNLDSKSFELFAGIAKKEFSDYLGAALAKIHLGEWSAAEDLLDTVTRTLSTNRMTDIVILHGLLAHIRQNVPLELIDDAYVDQLAEQVPAPGDSLSSLAPDIRLFCPAIDGST